MMVQLDSQLLLLASVAAASRAGLPSSARLRPLLLALVPDVPPALGFLLLHLAPVCSEAAVG